MIALFKKYFKPFVGLLVLACLLMVGRVVGMLQLPNYMSDIIDEGVITGDMDAVLSLGGVMVVWAVFAVACDILGNLVAARAAFGFGRRLRSAIYARVSAFGLPEIDRFGTSSLITRTTNDIQQLERFIQMCMTMAMMSPFMLVGAAVMACLTNLQLAGIVFAAIPVLIVIVGVVAKLTMPLLRSLQARIDKLNRVTREGITGIRVIRAYRKEGYEQGRFAQANSELAETNVAVGRRMGAMMPVASLVLNVVTILLVWVGAGLVDMNTLQVGDLMAIIQYAMHVLISAMMSSGIFMLLPRAIAAAERVKAVLETEPVVLDPPQPVHCAKQPAEPHSVRFENVSFAFPGTNTPALVDVDLTLKAGKTYAVLGATGSGKTAFVNLIERFYDPSTGRVLLDGVDVASVAANELRRQISYAPQKTVLFTGTLAENIAYGNEDATREDVERAAAMACATEFIAAKPEGLSTRITQAGGGLSGGQKQRIAIARTVARPAGLYIFDDSFSALDFATDAAVRRGLREELAGATVVIVAQRVSVAMDADCVIVFDEGRVVGMGTHDELMERCAVYRDIAGSQIDAGGRWRAATQRTDEGSLATASAAPSPVRDDGFRHPEQRSAEGRGASSKDPLQNASRSDAPSSQHDAEEGVS